MGEHPRAVTYEPIGVVRSPYTTLEGMPLQTGVDDADATVELDPRVHGTLRDLDGFSHLWLLVHLHRVDGWTPEVTPFLDAERPRGVLATRSPRRPNPIGLSLSRCRHQLGILRTAPSTCSTARRTLCQALRAALFDVCDPAEVWTGWFAAAVASADLARSDRRYGA